MSSLTTPITLLSAVVATGASRAVQVDAGLPAFLQSTGITVATVTFEGSLDGTNWSIRGTMSADSIVTLANAPPYLRANVTAWTSGTITVKILY